MRLAEQALESWKQLDEDRKRLVSEREQQLRDLSEVRGLVSEQEQQLRDMSEVRGLVSEGAGQQLRAYNWGEVPN